MQSGSGVYALNHFTVHKKAAGSCQSCSMTPARCSAHGVLLILPNTYDIRLIFPFRDEKTSSLRVSNLLQATPQKACKTRYLLGAQCVPATLICIVSLILSTVL